MNNIFCCLTRKNDDQTKHKRCIMESAGTRRDWWTDDLIKLEKLRRSIIYQFAQFMENPTSFMTDCKFFAVSCVGTPISFSLMARKKASTFSTEERYAAFHAVLEKTKKIDKSLQDVLIHLMKIGRFAAIDDETQDMFLGPKTQRITYNMPEFTLIPCFEDLKEETIQLSLQGGLLSIDSIRLIVRANVTLKITAISFPDADLIFTERPNECVEAYIPPQIMGSPFDKSTSKVVPDKSK